VVRHLLAGRSVCLRPLGTLRISFTSDGMEDRTGGLNLKGRFSQTGKIFKKNADHLFCVLE
ncbi:MAG: hypothetical protein ACFNOP_07285, partial [Bacteroides sp.]